MLYRALDLREPAFLYGGFSCKELRHKFLVAQESFSDPDFPKEIEIIPLRGHFFDMVGFRTPDDVVFLADCLSGKPTLEKYGITFIYDVAEYLKTQCFSFNKKFRCRAYSPDTENFYSFEIYLNAVSVLQKNISSLKRSFSPQRSIIDITGGCTHEKYTMIPREISRSQ